MLKAFSMVGKLFSQALTRLVARRQERRQVIVAPEDDGMGLLLGLDWHPAPAASVEKRAAFADVTSTSAASFRKPLKPQVASGAGVAQPDAIAA